MLSARCELTGLELPTCDLTKYFISLPYKATSAKGRFTMFFIAIELKMQR